MSATRPGRAVGPQLPAGSFRHGLPSGIVIGMQERAPEHDQVSLEPVLVTVDDVRAARERIAGVLRPTPVSASDTLSRLAGRLILLKPEHLQRTGSFMPSSAPLPKVDATTDYGATVKLGGEAVDDCIAEAKRFAAERGAVFVPPFDDPLIIAGQGTIGLEIAAEAPEAETVVVPVGGGGLIAGVSASLAKLRPDVRVVGVEASGAASMRASVDAGHPVSLPGVSTMADGIAVKSPSPLTLAHVRAGVHELLTVSEEEISQALLLLLERAKAVVEPAGAVALAAILSGKVSGTGPVVALLSGGNVDPLLLIKVIDHGLSAAGRYVVLRVVLDDRPGALAGLTAEVARLGLNVLSVEHHRSGLDLAMEQVEVRLTLETRNTIHSDEVVTGLRALGYKVEPLT